MNFDEIMAMAARLQAQIDKDGPTLELLVNVIKLQGMGTYQTFEVIQKAIFDLDERLSRLENRLIK